MALRIKKNRGIILLISSFFLYILVLFIMIPFGKFLYAALDNNVYVSNPGYYFKYIHIVHFSGLAISSFIFFKSIELIFTEYKNRWKYYDVTIFILSNIRMSVIYILIIMILRISSGKDNPLTLEHIGGLIGILIYLTVNYKHNLHTGGSVPESTETPQPDE